MTRTREIIASILENGATSPIILTTGHTCRHAYGIRDAPNHFYMSGSMGMAPLIGLGVARQVDRTTIVVDGDGALLMNPAALLTIGRYRPRRLLHVVVDNGRYASTGGQPSSSETVDLPAIARVAGYPACMSAGDLARLEEVLPHLIADPCGPHLLHVRADADRDPAGPRVGIEPAENFRRFRDWLTGLVPGQPPISPRKEGTCCEN